MYFDWNRVHLIFLTYRKKLNYCCWHLLTMESTRVLLYRGNLMWFLTRAISCKFTLTILRITPNSIKLFIFFLQKSTWCYSSGMHLPLFLWDSEFHRQSQCWWEPSFSEKIRFFVRHSIEDATHIVVCSWAKSFELSANIFSEKFVVNYTLNSKFIKFVWLLPTRVWLVTKIPLCLSLYRATLPTKFGFEDNLK